MRAYRKTRVYMNETPAAEIARAEKPCFPDIDEAVARRLHRHLSESSAAGRLTPKSPRQAYEKTLDIFEYNGLIKERYRYDQVCAPPPATD